MRRVAPPYCDGARIVQCAEDALGCRVLEVIETCPTSTLCLDAEGPPVCDGDFYARLAPKTDHPEAQWGSADGSGWFLLQLPREVTAGQAYTLETPDLLATLFWNTTVYTPHRNEAVLDVTVDTWQGAGGVASGSVSATMHSPLGGAIVISTGTWRAPIGSWTE